MRTGSVNVATAAAAAGSRLSPSTLQTNKGHYLLVSEMTGTKKKKMVPNSHRHHEVTAQPKVSPALRNPPPILQPPRSLPDPGRPTPFRRDRNEVWEPSRSITQPGPARREVTPHATLVRLLRRRRGLGGRRKEEE